MSRDLAGEMVVCATCGAVVDAGATRCWLCDHEVRAPAIGAATAAASSQAAGKPPLAPLDLGSIEASAWIVNILIVIVVAIVGVGLTQEAPGLAIAYGILVLPALAAMFVVALKRRRQGRPQGALAKVGTFFLGAAVTLFGIGALGVAAVVALFVFCFYLMATGQF